MKTTTHIYFEKKHDDILPLSSYKTLHMNFVQSILLHHDKLFNFTLWLTWRNTGTQETLLSLWKKTKIWKYCSWVRAGSVSGCRLRSSADLPVLCGAPAVGYAMPVTQSVRALPQRMPECLFSYCEHDKKWLDITWRTLKMYQFIPFSFFYPMYLFSESCKYPFFDTVRKEDEFNWSGLEPVAWPRPWWRHVDGRAGESRESSQVQTSVQDMEWEDHDQHLGKPGKEE